eukprot:1151230-Pelagomonas_calceolata.AAC.5
MVFQCPNKFVRVAFMHARAHVHVRTILTTMLVPVSHIMVATPIHVQKTLDGNAYQNSICTCTPTLSRAHTHTHHIHTHAHALPAVYALSGTPAGATPPRVAMMLPLPPRDSRLQGAIQACGPHPCQCPKA